MQVIISCQSLLKNIKLLSPIVNPNSPVPILECILIQAEKNSLKLLASDMDTSVSTIIPAEVKDKCALAIPAKTLQEILSNIPEQPLHIQFDEERLVCKIKTENGDYTISCQNPHDFPSPTQISEGKQVVIKSDILLHCIEKTIFAAGNDDIRQTMNGVYFYFTENDATFVATDAHKLVKIVRKDVKNEVNASMILPKKPLNTLKNMLSGVDDAVQITFSDKHAEFQFSQSRLICKLIEGKYPNYEAVIPKNNPNKLIIDKSSLLGSLKRTNIFTNKVTHLVRFKITGNQLEIKAEDSDYANEGHEILTCNYQGDDMEIGFNSVYLIELINNIDSEEAIMEMSTPSRAGIVLPANNAHPSEEMLMLVMPIMLNN
ncbi:MAG: DNA polymerase III subunit beta [Bacteroidia bacterium]|nr:DNA polymerase III subunit beta [Bacteroidia bacterium]